MKTDALLRAIVMLFFVMAGAPIESTEPVPDKLVVLTFDDSVASQYSVVRPLLKQYGFGATFFISEGFSFPTNKKDYMTWEQIALLHRDGFEIGNHTRDHASVKNLSEAKLREQLEAINKDCERHGIPKPVSFAYPGNAIDTNSIKVLHDLGIKFARRGGSPEYPYEEGRGFAYEPGKDHPLLIPSAGDARPKWTLDNFKEAVHQAEGGKIAVLQFHGVPDNEHAWVNTPPEKFRQYMDYLKTNNFHVIALRDLEKYFDPQNMPAEPMRIIEERKNKLK
jgi:peptidoglycan/xylan/chitin deacetylase (PgdA/CDA1 family)